MTQITCFNNTSLEELKTKFNDLTKDVTTEEQQQEIGITLVLDKYKQLQKQINALRKASNLSQSPIKTIESLIDIKAKYSKTVQDLQTKINSFNNELTNIQKEEDNQVAKQHEIEVDSKLVKIAIGDKTFTVEIAKTEEEKEIGLSNRESLDNNKGMLFVFDEPDEVSFWMKDTLIPLDIIFINDELEVISVHQGVPNSEEPMSEMNVSFVLEVNVNSGIKPGDELDLSPESQINKDKMLVLDSNGESQMELDGGERIFSRANTRTLIRFAKKAYSTQNDNDYKALGKRVFKFLQTQETNEPEFVKSKN